MLREQEQFLYVKIREGSEDAFNRAFELYYSRLCYFADHILHDFDSARSLVQEVFVDLWINRKKQNIPGSLKSFLFQTVKNKAFDVLKHRKVESKFMAYLQGKEETIPFQNLIEEAELNERINSAIQELPPRCRDIFILCRFEELKYSEIAERLNISVKTVEMQISIALKRIRQRLSDYQTIGLLLCVFSKKG